MTKQEYMAFHKAQCEKMIEITRKKNADYAGSGDDPFSNFRQIGNLIQQDGVVEIGFLTRMSDKFSRIGSFVSKGELKVKDESVEDTLLDLANYCILFAGFLRSQKIYDGTPIGTMAYMGDRAEGHLVVGGGSTGPHHHYPVEYKAEKPRSDLSSSNGIDIP